MIELLTKLFIKNYKDLKDPLVRNKYGILCGITGIVFNIILFIFKFSSGIISKSVSIMSDAFNNLSDAASSAAAVVGFKISAKKPDSEHPFGHGRMEYIAGLLIAFLILFAGAELLKSSVKSMINPEEIKPSIFTAVFLFFSIILKLYMYLYNSLIAEKIASAAMKASAKDSLGDAAATSAVFISILIMMFFPKLKIPIDGICGTFVALFIFYNGYSALKDTINPLLGVPADKELVNDISKLVLTHKPIFEVHDIIVHDYGAYRKMISLHAEVPGDRNIFELHDIIDNAEKDVSKKFGCDVIIHMDPVDLNNKKIMYLKKYLTAQAASIDKRIAIHDLRIVSEKSHTTVIFDAVHPHNSTISCKNLINFFEEKIKAYNPEYKVVIRIEQPFV